jgi:putative addiction module CopG family antidote
MQSFVEDNIKRGRYGSVSHVIEAALATLQQQERVADFDFPPGELNKLLAEAEDDFAQGDVYDGEEVFRELRDMAAQRRREGSV